MLEDLGKGGTFLGMVFAMPPLFEEFGAILCGKTASQ